LSFNLAENILAGRHPDRVSIHFAREGVPGVESITWSDLTQRTREAYDALVSYGIKPGDRVAVVMSNSVNTIMLCLATLAIGAVWSSTSPDLGSKAIIDRYRQIGAKVIFMDDAYVYAGKKISLAERIAAVSQALGETAQPPQGVVIVPYCGVPVNMSRVRGGIRWTDFMQLGIGRQLSFQKLSFSSPAFILFSSGTVRKIPHPS
jgi:acetoacetyl-CoA synthetase